MVVQTDTEKLRASRRFILSMLFSERNHFCPFCQLSGGDCELQNAAYNEGMTHWPVQPNWNTFKVDTSHPYFVLDNNRCILCRRCVRACAEITGNFTLGIAERGSSSMLVADCDLPLGESSCIECGNCVQACPTGALIDRQSAYQGLETRLTKTETTCVGCSVGCGVVVSSVDGHLVRIEGNWDAPVNSGAMCKTGRFLPVTDNRSRLKTPLVRKNGKLETASWEDALQVVANALKPLAGQNGQGLAALASSRLTAESLAAFKELFAHKLGSDMVTSMEEGFPTAQSAALAEELGQSFEGGLEALRSADCVLVVGADLAENHQVAGFFIKRSLPLGMQLIVLDDEENGMDELANLGLRFTPGQEAVALKALQAALAKTDADSSVSVSDLASKAGLALADVTRAAQMLAMAASPAIVYGKGVNGSRDAETLKALLGLAKMCGVVTAERSALFSVKGKANSVVVSQYGLDRPFRLNGHQAAYIVVGDDQPSPRLVDSLARAPFLAVQAAYESSLTEAADVVLPVTMWAEQEGHYVNLEGRLQAAHSSLAVPEGVKSNEQVFAALAEQLQMTLESDWKDLLFQRVSPVAIVEN